MKADTPHSEDPVLWSEENWRAKEKGKSSKYFSGDDETAEVVLRTIISVNQLSVYGAVADMCRELAWRISGCSERTGKLVAQDNPETTATPTELTTTTKSLRTDDNVEGNLLQNDEQKFTNLSEHLQLIKLCSNWRMRKLTNWVAHVEPRDDT